SASPDDPRPTPTRADRRDGRDDQRDRVDPQTPEGSASAKTQPDQEKEAPESKPEKNSEKVDPAELAKVLDDAKEVETKDKPKENEKPDAKPAAADEEKEPKEVVVKPDKDKADPKNAKPKEAPKVADAKPEQKPAPKPENKPAPKRPSTHIVQPGDTLYNIGQRYNVPAEAVARKNNISLNGHIRPGQSLKVPTVEESSRLMAQRSTPQTNPTPRSNTRSTSPPPGPVPYPLTPTSGLPQKPQTTAQVRTQPTQQQQAKTNATRPAIGVAPRHRTARPRPTNQPPGSQQPAPPTQWAHANGTFVPAGSQPKPPQQQPRTQPKVVAPTGVLRPVSGGMIHSTRSINYRVQPSDTLPSIAAGHSTTVGVISQVNGGLNSVSSGQIVIVPVDGILIETPKPRTR
ncbi:MAG: LysM peptidoglycan-binding domain-containing protein, partial [Verrucomicrobiota bacterium]